MTKIGTYILDTLQIYFPWDDDLYTYFKEHGLGSENTKKKALPLIYTDNCISTQGVDKIGRNYVLAPKYFGKELDEVGWEIDKKDSSKTIIPAEKARVEVTLLDEEKVEPKLKFRIVPTFKGKEEYHIEYSVMSAFGKMYSNWVAIYFTLKDFEDLISRLSDSIETKTTTPFEIKIEKKQAQRERMYYVEVPVASYCFCIGEFQYASDYLRFNGVTGDIPSLIFDSNDPSHLQKMSPFIKLGIVETATEKGFWKRNPQVVLKIAQPKVTKSKRGVHAKAKGIIDSSAKCENSFLVNAKTFLERSLKLQEHIRKARQIQSIIPLFG